jgi:hypothetical protein
LESLIDHLDEPLVWTQVKSRRFELLARDKVLARLEWPKTLRSLAVGETADGTWTFKRIGWLRQHISVSTGGRSIFVATLRLGAGRQNTIRFAAGPALVWKPTRVHRQEMAIFGADGLPLITFRLRHKILMYEAAVTISREAGRLAELPVLALLGQYRMALECDAEIALATAMLGASAAYSGT